MTTAIPVEERPSGFPSWPSGDCKIVAQIEASLRAVRERLRAQNPSPIFGSDAHDGLGPYEGFHIIDPAIGMVAFTSHTLSPFRGTSVRIDALSPAGLRPRLQALLEREQASWTDPQWQAPAGGAPWRFDRKQSG